MVSHVRLIAIRRSYEFAPDDLRLTIMSTFPVVQAIAEEFTFNDFDVERPPAKFGRVAATTPPGLVFSMGSLEVFSGELIAIRSIQVEPSRIVIEVAAPTGSADVVMERFREVVSRFHSPDGSPVLGDPSHVLDFSRISFGLDFEPSFVLRPELAELIEKWRAADRKSDQFVLVPSLTLHFVPKEGEVDWAELPPSLGFQFQLRGGATPDERVYYSSAPLDSDTHLRFVDQLEALMVGDE